MPMMINIAGRVESDNSRSIFYGKDLADKYRLTSFLVPSEVNRDKKPSECH